MKRACRHAAELLQQRAAGLSTAASLELEEHLSGCESCRSAANLLDNLRELHIGHTAQLTPTQREHAISGALAASSIGPASLGDRASGRNGALHALRVSLSARGWRPALWGVAPALAALALLALLGRPSGGPPHASNANGDADPKHAGAAPGAANSDVPPSANGLAGAAAAPARVANGSEAETGLPLRAADAGDRVLTGQVEVAGVEIGPGLALTEGRELSSAQGATLALGHATAQLRAASRVRWDAEQAQLQLIAGSVEVSVDPGPKRRFSVTTGQFTALVLGTVFEVSLERVRVREGRVRVIDRNGRELATLDAKKRASFELRQQPPQPSAAPDPLALLAQAREQIGQRQLAEARRSLSRVLALAITTEQRAEARTLQAECALVAGDYANARDHYLSVAREFPSLLAAQTALFAAARIEAQHGDAKRASELFRSYLDEYPTGRFAGEAAARLRSESAAPSGKPR